MVMDGAGTRTLSIQGIGEMHLILNQMHIDGITVQPSPKQGEAIELWAIRFLLNPLWAVVVDPQDIHRGTRAIFVCCNIGKNHASNKCHWIIPQ